MLLVGVTCLPASGLDRLYLVLIGKVIAIDYLIIKAFNLFSSIGDAKAQREKSKIFFSALSWTPLGTLWVSKIQKSI